MERLIDFVSLLTVTQQYLSQNYSSVLTDEDKRPQLKSYIMKFLQDNDFVVRRMSQEEVADRLFTEMAEFSILTPLLGRTDVEEINVNAWNDVAVTYTSGQVVKLQDHFYNPQHCIDVVKRLLRSSGTTIDEAKPLQQAHLENNTRVTALKTPLVDDDVGMAVSIRLLHPNTVSLQKIIEFGTGTQKMIDFLCYCIRYGVSLVIAGATSSGKTTLLNALLGTIPNEKRIFTIESGARELSLVRRNENGTVINNVVHTLSRPSDNDSYNIKQEDLVVASLRFNPDVIVVGEMRDREAHAAVEESLTGHTVVSTVHAYAAELAHTRIATLTKKAEDIDFDMSLMQAAQAFPIVVFAHKLEDNSRRIMDISECETTSTGERKYSTLFRYHITRNDLIDGKYHIDGHFEQVNDISDSLKKRLTQFGIPANILQRFEQKGADY